MLGNTTQTHKRNAVVNSSLTPCDARVLQVEMKAQQHHTNQMSTCKKKGK